MAINRKLSSRVGAAAVVIGLACAGAFFLQHTHRPQASAMAAIEEGVPVIAAVARAQDVPLFVRGIGTVQAYNMVVIKTRVDGAIVKVSFTEGQDVKAGDPRGLPAALPADHDDDLRGDRRRTAAGHRARVRAPSSAGRSGIAIVGGLLVSQWLTLYTTPVVYLYLDRLSRWLTRRGGHRKVAAE
jgi:hypothetical protein